ncbi:MAG: O-antigen ligase family protein [candidate division Zixibacteria bacterium]|nr:O-antigen ligase family protein [candidate division Zixibacteria bacterium]
MNRLPTLLTSIAFLILPFLFMNGILDPVLLPRFIALAAFLLVALVLILVRSAPFIRILQTGIHRRALVFALGGYVLFAVVSLSQASNTAEAGFDLSRTFLTIGMFVLLTLVTGRDRSAFGVICRVISLAAIGLSLTGLLQYYNLAFTDIPGNVIPYATMANRNLLISALCMMFPFVLYIVVQGDSLWRKLAAVSGLLSMVVIVISYTRAVWIAVATATIVTLVIFIVNSGRMSVSRDQLATFRKSILIGLAIMAAVIIICGGLLVRHGEGESVLDRIASLAAFDEGSAGQRLKLWDKSLAMFMDKPLLGVGPGNWKLNFAVYGTEGLRSEGARILYQRPHNDYLWILTESGLFALACYLAIFITALICCIRILRHSPERDDIVFSLLMVFGLVAASTVAFFSYPRERIVHSMLLSFMLASVLTTYVRTFPIASKFSRTAFLSTLAGLLVIVCFSLVTGYERLQTEIHTYRALSARAAEDWRVVIAEIDRARSPFMQIDHTATPLVWHRGMANYSLNQFDKAMVDFTEAYRVNPNHLHVLNNLATCYERLGDHQTAIGYYRRALELSPLFSETLFNLTASYYNAGLYDEALSTLQRVKYHSDDPRYIQYLGEIQRHLKDTVTD